MRTTSFFARGIEKRKEIELTCSYSSVRIHLKSIQIRPKRGILPCNKEHVLKEKSPQLETFLFFPKELIKFYHLNSPAL